MQQNTVRFMDRDLTVTFAVEPEKEMKSNTDKKRFKRTTTCMVTDAKSKKVVQGYAQCSHKDSFDESQGKLISLNRALDKIANQVRRTEKYKISQSLLGI